MSDDVPGSSIRRNFKPGEQLALYLALGAVNELTRLVSHCAGKDSAEWEKFARKQVEMLAETIRDISGLPENTLPKHPDAWIRWVQDNSGIPGPDGKEPHE